MKIFTLAIIGAALLSSVDVDAAPRVKLGPVKHSQKVSRPASLTKEMLRRAPGQESAVWRPQSEKNFGWDGEEWQLEDTYTIAYDKAGRTVSEVSENYDGEFSRTTFTYNDNGMLATQNSEFSEDGENYENSSKILLEYDSRLTDVITLRNEWLWMDGDWNQVGNNYKRLITRNDAGNITLVEIASLYQGEYDPMQRLTIVYGEDGKATELRQSVLSYDGENFEWIDDTPYTNITWENFDGQVVNIDNLFIGGNRLKSADIIDEEMTMHVEVEYDGDNYVVTMTGNDGEDDFIGKASYRKLDDNGSYQMSNLTQYLYGDEVYYEEVEDERVEYNEWGNLLLSKVEWTDGTYVETYENLVGTVEYDPEHGYPVSYTVTEEYFDEYFMDYVTENRFRAEYYDYVDASAGVAAVEADSNSPVEYYNLQGIKIDSPAAGNVYIRRQGGDVTKVLVR